MFDGSEKASLQRGRFPLAGAPPRWRPPPAARSHPDPRQLLRNLTVARVKFVNALRVHARTSTRAPNTISTRSPRTVAEATHS
eukprot:6182064-Pleurochrysis_carterae.AAC.1